MRECWGNSMDSSTSLSGLRVALVYVGGSSEVEGAVASLSLAVFSVLVLVSHGENLGDEELDTQCFTEGDSLGGGSVCVEAAVSVRSKIVSMQRNTKSELPGGSGLPVGSGLTYISLLRLSMTRELKCPPSGGSSNSSVGRCALKQRGAEGHQWNNLWFRCYPKYTQMWYCAIN